jgi:hypothetical protein
MNQSPLRSLGNLIVKAYMFHLMWFTVGAIAGAVECFMILTAMYGPVPQ